MAQWIEGARPRTLPNAVSPVLVGTGAAIGVGGFNGPRAVLALVVAVAFVVGVNYANDYSDGIRGTDERRVGPVRLVGSGTATPPAVRAAAVASLAVGAVAGLGLVAASRQWWLLAVGAACIAAAWLYTGGRRPYGYSGLGEAAVFVFFGPVAVLGTQFTQAGRVTGFAALAAVGVGLLSCAVLVANNLRDIPTDTATGKHTLPVLLGAARTRRLYAGLAVAPFGLTAGLALRAPWTLLGLLAVALAVPAVRQVHTGAVGPALVRVLRDTGAAMLVWSLGTAVGLALRLG